MWPPTTVPLLKSVLLIAMNALSSLDTKNLSGISSHFSHSFNSVNPAAVKIFLASETKCIGVGALFTNEHNASATGADIECKCHFLR